MMDIEALVRPDLKNLKPYTSARHLHQTGLLLDANENPFGSLVRAPFDLPLNRYPDPYCKTLKKALSKFLEIAEDRLFVGVGSDEIIDLLIRLFLSPGEKALLCEPTYGMYRTAAGVAGIGVENWNLTSDFQLDLAGFEKARDSKVKLIFACSPNNPTGSLLSACDIESLCRMFSGIVVLDEAYVEFSSKPSLVGRLNQLDNLVVMRTFSKAFGLAGARVGYAAAHPEIVRYLNKIKPPYNMNSLSAFLAVKALARRKRFLKWRKLILRERAALSKKFAVMGFEVFPSQANFILVRRAGASKLVARLAGEYGIIIRDMSDKPGLADCARVSVGTPADNKRLLKAVGELLK